MTAAIGTTDASDESVLQFSKGIGATLVTSGVGDDKCLAFEFTTLAEAKVFVLEMNILTFPDEQGHMIGREEDSLVEEFHYFRIPTTLNLLLHHLNGGKLVWNAANSKWVFDVSWSSTPEQAGRLLVWFKGAFEKLGSAGQ